MNVASLLLVAFKKKLIYENSLNIFLYYFLEKSICKLNLKTIFLFYVSSKYIAIFWVQSLYIYIYVSQSGFEFSIMIFWVIIGRGIIQTIVYFIFSNYTSLWYISHLRVIIMISLPSLCVFFLYLTFSNPRPHFCMLTFIQLTRLWKYSWAPYFSK